MTKDTKKKNENLKHFEILIQKYRIWNTIFRSTYILIEVEFIARNNLGRFIWILFVSHMRVRKLMSESTTILPVSSVFVLPAVAVQFNRLI